MKIHLGVIGADDSMKRILEVAQGYPSLEVHPYIYWDENEVIPLLSEHAHTSDMWLFSGKIPYEIARAWGQLHVPLFYLEHTGFSLYPVLLYLAHEHDISIREISLDTITAEEISKMLHETGIVSEFPREFYSSARTRETLIRHHEELYRQGRVKAVVTCLRSAHLALADKGIPAHHVLSTRFAIERALSDVIQTFEMLHFRDSQIAVQLFEFTSVQPTSATPAEPNRTPTEPESIEGQSRRTESIRTRQVTAAIEGYAKKLQGSVRWMGETEGMILTTRGALADVTEGFRKKASDLEGTTQSRAGLESMSCGIGIGRTVFEAQENATMAMRHARKYRNENWVVVFDNKKIKVFSDKDRTEQQSLSYDYADEGLQNVADIAGLSVSTLSKVTHVLHKLGTDELTANELAQNLQILPRSARRILGTLEKSGFAKVRGEETPFMQGRPRKLYQITLRKQK
ncbi:ArsR family transcriptional regulator [Alicyclobacillus sp. SO9]|uniref:ArsR family transcriptional regulator n=1 Tax=Alicyclobacillus sp. SO9 TaxID=2665646 RepID=UPI0018E90430|nr:ArsR family transcriptional regulator [Alicyclobacillus sp. SO9]QQE77125.1 ArsR family transcriptional regulator [Alicyclobacillus sp. SO9]